MSNGQPGPSAERVLILTPSGRDAELAAALLREAGRSAVPCVDLDHFVAELKSGAGLAVVADEALGGPVGDLDLSSLAAWVAAQPPWSDFPFVVLTRRGGGLERNPGAGRLSKTLGNVSFLERPFHPTTLVSVVMTSVRARRRQYDARARLEELHASEENLRRLNEGLEAEVVLRTAEREHAQDQLRQAQKMEVVGQLTGGIAHDFNNLLQGIVGSLELAKKRVAQERYVEIDRFVDNAMGSAKRAAALTHRLLAFSRRQPLDPKTVEPNHLVSAMAELLRRTMGERYDVQMLLGAGLWSTRCDPNQLESALLNLAINARDAMPEGGRLLIRTHNAVVGAPLALQQDGVPRGEYVCVEVTDSGSGMAPHVIEHAFEPFFTTKPIGQGTGLGLSMVYGFARQSEGYAEILSEVGKGTTVSIYLPRSSQAAEAAEPGDSRRDAHHAGDGEHVLVVEDEPVVRNLIVELIGDLGYRAIEAVDGPSGVDLLRSNKQIDLLVTDMGLPGLNGREVAQAGRIARPGLKVLFMTGYAENAALASGFLEPGMGLITKPFALETLAERMRDMIERA